MSGEAREMRETTGGLLREVLHVGIVVENLDRAVAEWERLFGVRARDRWQSEIGVKVAFFEIGGPVLARREGVHHLCFRVDDLDAALEEVAARGLRVVPGFPVEGAHGRIAFLEPEATTGLITELCQVR